LQLIKKMFEIAITEQEKNIAKNFLKQMIDLYLKPVNLNITKPTACSRLLVLKSAKKFQYKENEIKAMCPNSRTQTSN